MNRFIAVLLILVSLTMAGPAQCAGMQQEPEEGYALPTYPELMQTFIMMGGLNITDTKVADDYGRLVYCDLYQKNFKNDAAWERLRSEIVERAVNKKEYFRIKYEVVGVFYLDRYDFKNNFFPISKKSPITNVGSVNLFSINDIGVNCVGQSETSSVFPVDVIMKLNEPLTVVGFRPTDTVEKLLVRLEEAGDTDRRIYGRIRLLVTDAKGIEYDEHGLEAVLNGKVISVDFFLDRDLTKQIAHLDVNKE